MEKTRKQDARQATNSEKLEKKHCPCHKDCDNLIENNAAQYRGSWDIEGFRGVIDTGQVSLRFSLAPQEFPGRLSCTFCLFQFESSRQAAISTQSDSLQTCG
jgi:hypothetical protein